MDRRRSVIGTVIAILIVIVLVIVIVSLLWNWPNGTFQEPGRFPYWFFGLFLFLIFFGLIVRLIFWALLGPRYRWRYWDYGRYGGYGGSAEEILDQRYAKGEITREQYLQMKDDLYKRQSKVQ
jgi:putative membrane protein